MKTVLVKGVYVRPVLKGNELFYRDPFSREKKIKSVSRGF